MQGEDEGRWKELCAQAATEQDPEKLMVLVEEINRLLERKAERLKATRKSVNGLSTKDRSDPNSLP